MSLDDPLFLDVEDVLEIHAIQLEVYGGSPVNGITVDHASEALYELTMGVAEGRLQKAAVAGELERIANSGA